MRKVLVTGDLDVEHTKPLAGLSYLLIASLHAHEDHIGRYTSHAPLKVRRPSDFLCFGIVIVQGLHCFLKVMPFHLEQRV